MERAPNDIRVSFEIGKILMDYRREEKGLFWLQRVLGLQPGHRGAHQELARFYRHKGDQERAALHANLAGGRR